MSALIALLATVMVQPETKSFSTVTLVGGKKGLYTLKYEVPQLNEKSAVAKFANDFALKYAKDWRTNYLKSCAEFVQGGDRPTNEWTSELSGDVSVVRDDLVSLVLYHYEYSGGAHPNHWSVKINVGLINGKPKLLTLKDILKPGYDPDLVINTYVLPSLDAQRRAKGIDWSEPVSETAYDDFLLTPGGIAWLFDPYVVGSYAEGDYFVKLFAKDMGKESPFQNWVFRTSIPAYRILPKFGSESPSWLFSTKVCADKRHATSSS